MNRIKEMLTRKLGPLPAWVWLSLFAAAAFYYYRRIAKTTATSPTGEVVGQTGAADPLALAPGESVYDPNTGVLTGTSPGQYEPFPVNAGDSVFNPSTGGLSTAPGPPNPQGEPGPQGPAGAGAGTPPGHKPPPKKPPRLSGGKAPAKGAKPAPFGHKKPKAPKGFHTVGTGAGNWWFVPTKHKGTPKPKPGHRPSPPKPPGRPRGGGGAHGNGNGRPPGRGSGGAAPAPPRRYGGAPGTMHPAPGSSSGGAGLAVPDVAITKVPPGGRVGAGGVVFNAAGHPIGGYVPGAPTVTFGPGNRYAAPPAKAPPKPRPAPVAQAAPAHVTIPRRPGPPHPAPAPRPPRRGR